MHFKAYMSLALVVALVYLTSSATAATYKYNPAMRSTHPNTLPSGKTGEGQRNKRWIDFTATAITHFVDAALPRQARANWTALGLDNTEVFKVRFIMGGNTWKSWLLTLPFVLAIDDQSTGVVGLRHH